MKYYINLDKWFYCKEGGYTELIKNAISFKSKEAAIEYLKSEGMADSIDDVDILTEDELMIKEILE